MHFLARWLLIFSVLFSSLNPFILFNTCITSVTNTSKTIDEPSVNENIIESSTEVSTEEDTGYKVKNFVSIDLEGYCTIEVPESHFTLNSSNSTNVYKTFTYKDKKSRLYMGYVTDIDTETDIPGYITIEVAGVQTVTNGKTEETYGDNQSWMMIPSENKEDGCNVYVWYTLNSDKTSAIWVKAKVTPDSDTDEFRDVMRQIFNSYSCYQVPGGSIFATPNTGYYASAELNDGKAENTEGYRANTKAYTVFQTRGGYVSNADISENWQDLQIIIDGHKFELPCKMDDFYSAGFKINDRTLDDNSLTVYPDNTMKIKLINDKGTVISVTAKNASGTEKMHVDDCQVVTLKIDRGDFVSMANANVEEFSSTEEESTEASEEESNTEESTEEQSTEEYEKRDSEVYKAKDTDAKTGNITDKLSADDSYEQHEMIIAGGVTWSVYSDDLISYFGQNMSRVKWNNGKQYKLTWQESEKSMTVVIGVLHTIQSVELSCVSLN